MFLAYAMNKRGQFYMIAAIILAAIIFGIVAISNYLESGSTGRIYILRDELQLESSKVIEYGIYNDLSSQNIRELQEDFVENYTNYRKTENFYFIIGNPGDITVMAYQSQEEDASVIIDGSETELDITGKELFSQGFSPSSDTIEFRIDNTSQVFELNGGENFYFVIHGVTEGSVYFVTNNQ